MGGPFYWFDYYWSKYKQNYTIHEDFDNKDIKIIQNKDKGFTLDDYTDDKGTFKTGGIWNMDKTDFYLEIDKKKYKITDNKNIYSFDINGHNTILTYSKTSGDIVIDNHHDEIIIVPTDKGYEYKRGNKILAIITEDIISNDDNKYTLRIEENPEYKWIYITTFIIYNQKEKEINISLDDMWKST